MTNFIKNDKLQLIRENEAVNNEKLLMYGFECGTFDYHKINSVKSIVYLKSSIIQVDKGGVAAEGASPTGADKMYQVGAMVPEFFTSIIEELGLEVTEDNLEKCLIGITKLYCDKIETAQKPVDPII